GRQRRGPPAELGQQGELPRAAGDHRGRAQRIPGRPGQAGPAVRADPDDRYPAGGDGMAVRCVHRRHAIAAPATGTAERPLPAEVGLCLRLAPGGPPPPPLPPPRPPLPPPPPLPPRAAPPP